MQRYTKKGVEIELIGPNTAEQGGYKFVDNSVTYYDDNGLNYQEFSTYHTFNCAEDGTDGMSCFMSYYILKAIAKVKGVNAAIAVLRAYFGGSGGSLYEHKFLL